MARAYFLTTERVGFSRWDPDDLDLATSLWGSQEVARYLCANGRFTDQEIAGRLKAEIQHELQYGVQYWPVFERGTGTFIGCCGLRPHREKEFELGFHLRPEFWGKGYATEAAKAVIGYTFRVIGAKKLFAGHHPKNTASRKVITKLGFQFMGDEYYEPTGLLHPSYELTITPGNIHYI